MKAQWTLEGLRKPIGISTYTDNLIQKVEHHLGSYSIHWKE